jgi:hypothetical protein
MQADRVFKEVIAKVNEKAEPAKFEADESPEKTDI